MSVILQLVILILSATLHEVAHGYVAYSLGDPTAKLAGRLTLNPLAHLDIFGSIVLPLLLYLSTAGAFVFGWAKPVPYNPYNLRAGKWGPTYVALAGPLTNLSLAVIFAIILRTGIHTFSATFISICVMIVLTNVALAVFNLIPIPPLDGSKLLYALLPYSWRGVEAFLEQYRFILLIVLLMAGGQIISVPAEWLARLLLGV